MTGGVVWREGRGEDNIDTMQVLFLIPARRGSDLVGSEMFPHNLYLMQVLFLIPVGFRGQVVRGGSHLGL